MRTFSYATKSLKVKPNLEITYCELRGFINASTYPTFEKLLTSLAAKAKHLIVDFHQVDYVNSTTIGALVAAYDTIKQAGGDMVLTRVHRAVGNTMRLLGITQVVPFIKDARTAARYFSQPGGPGTGGKKLSEKPGEPAPPTPKGRGLVRKPLSFNIKQESVAPLDCSVLVVVPGKNVFTDILKMRLGQAKRKFTLVSTAEEALAAFDVHEPDLIIVEDSLPGADEFIRKVKTEKKKSFLSIIKVYEKGRPAKKGEAEFRVWEDDFLVEPFEMMELFALSEAELARLPSAKEVRMRQLHFTCRGSDPNVQKALELGRGIVFNVGLEEDKAVTLFAAFQEAMDNAVRHGNRHNPKKHVDVSFLVDSSKIVLTVEDEGEGFDFSKYIDFAKTQDAATRARMAHAEGRIGGLGIKLMFECCDKLAYLSPGNKIRLEKKIPAVRTVAPEAKA